MSLERVIFFSLLNAACSYNRPPAVFLTLDTLIQLKLKNIHTVEKKYKRKQHQINKILKFEN